MTLHLVFLRFKKIKISGECQPFEVGMLGKQGLLGALEYALMGLGWILQSGNRFQQESLTEPSRLQLIPNATKAE